MACKIQMQMHYSYKIKNNMNDSDKHFQQLVLRQISELLPTKQMQIHYNYKIHNNMNTSDKHFQQLLLQQIAQLLQIKAQICCFLLFLLFLFFLYYSLLVRYFQSNYKTFSHISRTQATFAVNVQKFDPLWYTLSIDI